MPHLESLKLKFDSMSIGRERAFPARITYLIPEGHVWPKLKKLELGAFQTSESQLVDLLERHADTLKYFRLREDIEVDAGGSWISLLHRIKPFHN
jgi:hypothetical protein